MQKQSSRTKRALSATPLLAISAVLTACTSPDLEKSTLRFHWTYQALNGDTVSDLDKADTLPENLLFFANENGEGLFVETPAIIDETCLKSINVDDHPGNGGPILNFQLTFQCSKTFEQETGDNIGRQMAVVVNEKLITAPRIRSAIVSGSGFIEGVSTSKTELEELAKTFY